MVDGDTDTVGIPHWPCIRWEEDTGECYLTQTLYAEVPRGADGKNKPKWLRLATEYPPVYLPAPGTLKGKKHAD